MYTESGSRAGLANGQVALAVEGTLFTAGICSFLSVVLTPTHSLTAKVGCLFKSEAK